MPDSQNTYTGLPEQLASSLKIVVKGLVRDGLVCGHDTEDLEQELALHGWRALQRYRPESSVPLEYFLRRVIRRRAAVLLGLRARKKRRYGELLTSLEQVVESEVRSHEQTILSLDLEKVLARLPRNQRQVVRLLEIQPVGEIADALGVSRGVVYRLLRHVRRALERAGYPPPATRQHSKREKLPMQNAATAEGAIAPAKPAVPKPTDNRMRTSYSMWSLFRNCRRAARFRYLDRIVPIERNPNLAFGSLIHECLETWHRDRDLEAVLEHIDTACAGRHASEDERRDWHCARAMMTGYAKACATKGQSGLTSRFHVLDQARGAFAGRQAGGTCHEHVV